MFGLSLVVLAWTVGKRRIPLAFLPYFGEEEGRLDLALLGWARAAGLRPEGVLFDAWYAAKWLHAHGGSFVTRLRSNRVLDGVQLRRHGGTRWVKTGKGRSTGFGEPSRRFSGGFSGNWGGRGIGTGVGPGGWPIWPWGWWPMGASSGSGRGWG